MQNLSLIEKQIIDGGVNETEQHGSNDGVRCVCHHDGYVQILQATSFPQCKERCLENGGTPHAWPSPYEKKVNNQPQAGGSASSS